MTVAHPQTPRIRVGLGMLGLDVHTKGIRSLAVRLRDRGFEVIMFGEHLTAEQLASGVVAEDVDVVGVSFSSAAYVKHCRNLLSELKRQGADEAKHERSGQEAATLHPCRLPESGPICQRQPDAGETCL